MKKESLKTGAIVEFNNGERAILLKDVDCYNEVKDILVCSNYQFVYFDDYDDDLKEIDVYYNNDKFKINKIYIPEYAGDAIKILNGEYSLRENGIDWSWECPKPKKMTKKQIEEELGYEIIIEEEE